MPTGTAQKPWPFRVSSRKKLLSIPHDAKSLEVSILHRDILQIAQDCDLLHLDHLESLILYGDVAEEAEKEFLKGIYESPTIFRFG